MRLSVVIPAFNRAHLIGETLRSLLVQSVAADEIIVVDDGSTDDTAAVAASFGGSVRVIRQANRGPAAARNAGFRASRGEVVHFFDSDDLAAFNKHEAQLAVLNATGADIVLSPWVQGRICGTRFFADNHVLQQRGMPPAKNLVRELLSCWSSVPHMALFRRSMVEAVGGFPEDLFGTEDQFMLLACLLAGADVAHAPETIMFYRLGEPGKITERRDWAVRRAEEWARFLIKAREACLTKGVEPLQWFGFRRRVWEALQELRKFSCADANILEPMERIAPGRLFSLICHWHRQIERWKGGLQQRITGGRALTCFQIGPMTPRQVVFLGKLGYSLEGPRALAWFRQNERFDTCVG